MTFPTASGCWKRVSAREPQTDERCWCAFPRPCLGLSVPWIWKEEQTSFLGEIENLAFPASPGPQITVTRSSKPEDKRQVNPGTEGHTDLRPGGTRAAPAGLVGKERAALRVFRPEWLPSFSYTSPLPTVPACPMLSFVVRKQGFLSSSFIFS